MLPRDLRSIGLERRLEQDFKSVSTRLFAYGGEGPAPRRPRGRFYAVYALAREIFRLPL